MPHESAVQNLRFMKNAAQAATHIRYGQLKKAKRTMKAKELTIKNSQKLNKKWRPVTILKTGSYRKAK